MSKILLLLSSLFLMACVAEPEVDEAGGGSGGANRKPGAAKNIEAGTDLFFTCVDEVSENIVTASALWGRANSRLWTVSLEERNRDGQFIMGLTNVDGYAGGDYTLLIKPASYFSQISQTGVNTASLYGMGRTLSCQFR